MTANRFTVNNVTYTARPFTYDLVCDLEDMGVTYERIQKMPMSLVRAYFALCAEVSKEEAAEIIQKHMIAGGQLDDIAKPMAKEMNDSDFFRALAEKTEQSSTERKGAKKSASEE